MRQGIVEIPAAGGSGVVSSGAIQFRDDWPGLFIRGDDCIGLMSRLLWLRGQIDESLFAASRLKELLEVIERDVIVRSGP